MGDMGVTARSTVDTKSGRIPLVAIKAEGSEELPSSLI